MRYKTCIIKCKDHAITSKEPAIRMLLDAINKIYGKKITTCEDFCAFYIFYLSVGTTLFGDYFRLRWRQITNRGGQFKLKCSHCGQVFDNYTMHIHVVEYMKNIGLDPWRYVKEVDII